MLHFYLPLKFSRCNFNNYKLSLLRRLIVVLLTARSPLLARVRGVELEPLDDRVALEQKQRLFHSSDASACEQ